MSDYKPLEMSNSLGDIYEILENWVWFEGGRHKRE